MKEKVIAHMKQNFSSSRSSLVDDIILNIHLLKIISHIVVFENCTFSLCRFVKIMEIIDA